MGTAVDRFQHIIGQGLCVGCGLCEAIAGPERVRCGPTAGGEQRPFVVGPLDEATVDAIYAACPGVRVTGLPSQLAEGATVHPVWGPWRLLSTAWAADPELRRRGSTGGVLTALGSYLLESGEVDAVLHARPSTTEAGWGDAHLSRTSADVVEGAGSRYGPTAVLSRLREALDHGERLAVIAKPCDISAIRLRSHHDERIGRHIRYLLTMVCGGMMAPAGLVMRMRAVGVEPDAVSSVHYRGDGCPGPTRFTLRDGGVVEMSYLDFWGDDESQWILPYRCKICPDGIGEAADLAAADTWPGGSPRPEDLEGDPGTNGVIVRTAAGVDLYRRAVAAGYLVEGGPATVEDFTTWQPHHVRKRQAAWARQAGRRRVGATPIELVDLRAESLARAQPCSELRAEMRGSMRRVADGFEPVEIWPAAAG